MTEKKTFEVGKTYTWYKDAPNPFKVVAVDLADPDFPSKAAAFICVYTKRRSNPFRVHADQFEHHVEYKEPITVVRYLNYYPGGFMSVSYPSRERADELAGDTRLACKKVIITEGEFDA